MDAFVTNKPIRPGSIQLAVGRGIENEEAFLSTLVEGEKRRGKRRKKGRSEMGHESRSDTRERGRS